MVNSEASKDHMELAHTQADILALAVLDSAHKLATRDLKDSTTGSEDNSEGRSVNTEEAIKADLAEAFQAPSSTQQLPRMRK